jgi:hypothetical protein
MRRKYQLTRNRVQLHNRLEALLEEAHIKVSSVVSDLLGTSARRMLQALAEGETDPARQILLQRVRYEERGPAVTAEAKKVRARKDDPRASQSRLPRRVDFTRSDAVSDFRPWLIQAA